MKRLQEIAEGISHAGAIVGGALLLVAALTICVDIFLRYAFSLTIGGADDLSGYALAISSAWGFSLALLRRSHIRIDTVYVRVKSRAARAALDLLSLGCLGLFGGLVAWHGWGVLSLSWASNSHSQSAIEMPLIYPQGLWFAGLAFFVMVAVLLVARAVRALIAGRPDELFRLIGSKSAVDEAEEEIKSIEHAMEEGKTRGRT
ncbi:MAG TPA: TRAP transporter small permease [Burkholderiales bacterium]|nr:TRAP transporter small permease [Burkholderiales bacterium]